jgi:hypothetical protein
MLVVAPWEESAAVDASMLDVGKGQRKVRAIFERLEVRPAKWVIIKDMRLREALRDAETAEELRDGLRCYRGSAISVNRQVRFDPKNEDNPRSPLALSFAGYEFLDMRLFDLLATVGAGLRRTQFGRVKMNPPEGRIFA